MPKVTLGITGLPENLGRDYGIENPIGDPLFILDAKPMVTIHKNGRNRNECQHCTRHEQGPVDPAPCPHINITSVQGNVLIEINLFGFIS